MRKIFQNDSGAAGVEFALIAPMISVVLLGIASGWSFFLQDSNMRDAVEVAAKYYIQGGTSDTTSLSFANASWVNKPADGSISVNRSCICVSTTVSCGTGVVCSDNTVPQIKMTITATSTWSNLYAQNVYPLSLSLSESEVVRVR